MPNLSTCQKKIIFLTTIGTIGHNRLFQHFFEKNQSHKLLCPIVPIVVFAFFVMY
jgi:hypothetical protein